jgi:translin
MPDLSAIAESLRADMDRRNSAREAVLRLSREVVRAAANTIRAVHRHEFADAAQALAHTRRLGRDMVSHADPYPEIMGAGYVHDSLKEVVEAAYVLALAEESALPSREELDVPTAAYLNGIAEAASELRRHVLDLMRAGDMANAERLLRAMDDIYDLLVTFDYPDALTHGLRRTTDALRAVLERTRGDLTNALVQESLRAALLAASPRSGPESTA